jgi:hypothetical protein
VGQMDNEVPAHGSRRVWWCFPAALLLLVLPIITGCGSPKGDYLVPFSQDQFLNVMITKEATEDSPARYADAIDCLDGTGKTVWSADLHGYAPAWVATSPDLSRAAIGALTVADKDGSRSFRLLLIDLGAKEAEVKILREVSDIKDVYVGVDLSRDGQRVGLFLTSTSATAEDAASKTTAEVMDTQGTTQWTLPVPDQGRLWAWAMDDGLSTAAFTILQNSSGQSSLWLVNQTSLKTSVTVPYPAVPALSPDGQSLALTYGKDANSVTMTVYTLGEKLNKLWAAQVSNPGFFSSDGTKLVWSAFKKPAGKVQVLSAADGKVLWEKTVQSDAAWLAGMDTFASAFVYQCPTKAAGQTFDLVDLTDATPKVSALTVPQDVESSRLWVSWNGKAILGLDGNGAVFAPAP